MSQLKIHSTNAVPSKRKLGGRRKGYGGNAKAKGQRVRKIGRRNDGKKERDKEKKSESQRDGGRKTEGIEAVMDLIIVDPRKTRDRSEMLL